jgi:hypothetical protein
MREKARREQEQRDQEELVKMNERRAIQMGKKMAQHLFSKQLTKHKEEKRLKNAESINTSNTRINGAKHH